VAAPAKRAQTFQDQSARRRFIVNFRLFQAGKLTCKNHKDLPAVGICNYCGYGVCTNCRVVLGQRRYCKQDAERLLKRTRMADPTERGRAITTAAALSSSQGVLAGAVGFLFIILGLIAPSIQTGSLSSLGTSFAYFDSVFAFPSATIIVLGTVLFMLGILDIFVGIMLWRSSKIGGFVGVVSAAVTGSVEGSYVSVFAVIGPLLYLLVGLAVAVIVVTIIGWSRLR
jgi:hypothetical protein